MKALLLSTLLLSAGGACAQTTTFAYTGGPQTYTVPAGVTQLAVVATGASGGIFSVGTYSRGATVQATVTVTPGEVLTVVVGGQGSQGQPFNPGGFNGGGNGIANGGGGGATDLRRARSVGRTDDYQSDRNALVVAGGGGGSDFDPYAGGNGGTPTGGDGVSSGAGVGYGATPLGPGLSQGASPGANEMGGAGRGYGGGGGGGYYGGGGGGNINYAYSGGGGGSSFVTLAGSRAISYRTATSVGNGLLTLTPAAALATGASVSAATITFYPNPARLAATLVLSGLPTAIRQVQATVLDAVGRPVGHHLLCPAGGALPLTGVGPGLYLVRLTAQDGQGQEVGNLPAQRLWVE